MNSRLLVSAASLLVIEALAGDGARAEPVPRPAPAAGSVVATRVGEEIEFVEAPAPRGLEVLQDVKAGDVVRTNALGQVAILFADQTQLRLGRNSTLVVRELAPGGTTRLELTEGRLFGRTPRGGAAVEIETPAATAAIRGTDWSLAVDGPTSSLLVLDGVVDFVNPQGAVTVGAGEAATATLGSAPSKVVVISTDLREQMLVNLSLRGAFEAFSPYALSGPRLRAEATRLAAIPPAARTAEDRVLVAELALEQEGRAAALAAVAAARAVPLSRGQAARVTLVEAIVAGAEGRYAEAARLFDAAAPGLSGEQASAARYQAYFARSLAQPTRALPPPAAGSDRASVVGQAIIAAFLDGPSAAYAIMRGASPRFANDAAFQASLAEAAMLAGDLDGARAAADRAVALDPALPDALSARASVRAQVLRDLDGALADLEAAIAATPANADLWNDLGLLQDARGATRAAEEAYLQAIALDPEDPVARANYAVLLLETNRIEAADAQIEAAIALDPAFELGYFAVGRRQLQAGERAAAIESLLRATTANPAFSNGLMLLGAAYAENRDYDLAEQALDNAARLDPNDPLVSQYRSSLATFLYRADDAIRFAQDSVRQTRARGGDYASIAATRDFGSTLGSAYRLLSLGAWGDYWSDVVFNPFDPGGYFDRSITGSSALVLNERERQVVGPDPTFNANSFSDLLQGLLLDPLALVAPNLRPHFLRTPFNELDLGVGPIDQEGNRGWNGSVTFQSLGQRPAPYSLLVSGTYDSIDPDYGDQDESTFSGLLGFGLQPTRDDRLVAFFNGISATGGLAFATAPETQRNSSDIDYLSGFVGWSHTFGYRNVLNASVSSTRIDQDDSIFTLDPYVGLFPARYDSSGRVTTTKAGLAHMFGWGDVTFRYGIEGGELESRSQIDLTVWLPPELGGEVHGTLAEDEATQGIGRVWIDGLVELGDRLRIEAALFGTYVEDAEDETVFAPRIGIAWAPVDGHWLRAGFLREVPAVESNTLAPIGLLGLDPVSFPSGTGQVDTAIARWDAEWTRRFFTAVEYQHQEVEDLSIPVAGYSGAIAAPDATLDRLQVSANLWLDGGFGLFATAARNWSDASFDTGDAAIPLVPDVSARFGITHVNPRLFTVTLAETYLGERDWVVAGGEPLDGVWTTDATASWESPNRRVALDLGVFNIFDQDYEIAPSVNGIGRTFTATLQARF